MSIINSNVFSLVLLPLLIFLARITDVTIGTLRIIFISRDLRTVAALAGFFEILIWLFAISQIMSNLTNVVNYVAYAGGFAVGNYIGITIERRIAFGYQIIRIITQRDATDLEKYLREANHIVTSVNAEGSRGPVKILFTVIKRKHLHGVVDSIKKFNPQAFYTVEDLRFVSETGIVSPVPPRRGFRFPSLRKGK
ncbi:MAG: DUF2179 domain-containing protein [bacterium]|nr:MAG: DUF2179 domain-containing protein [bacterium]